MSNTRTSASDWLPLLLSKAASLRFGSLQITIHEGAVVQIDCIEKTRIQLPSKLPEESPFPG